MNDTQKYKAISQLQQDLAPRQIADDLDISYGGVLKLKREFEEAKLNGTIDELLDANKLVLTETAERLSDLASTEKAVEEITKGLSGLEQLSTELQSTASVIITRVRSQIMSIDHMSELEGAADIICKLQTAFLNKNMTQVNVQNNFSDEGNTPKYNQFLSDKPVD